MDTNRKLTMAFSYLRSAILDLPANSSIRADFMIQLLWLDNLRRKHKSFLGKSYNIQIKR